MASSGLYSPSPAPALNATEQNELGQTYLVITSNQVTDSQLTTSLWLNAMLGAICFLAFCILQRSVFPKHYRYRLTSPSVTVKPRSLPERGWRSYWWWLRVAIKSTEGEIMRSCGLDAVVMIKALSMGVKIFMPLAVIGCGVLLPLHYKYRSFDNQDINRSPLMQLTIAALPRGSELMWVHFFLIVLYNCWVMWVLFARYKEFVICRQHYLVKGDDPNYWIAATISAETQYMKQKVQRMLAEIHGKHLAKKSDPTDEPPAPEPGFSASPEPHVRDSGQSGLRGVVDKVGQSWSNMFTSWRSRANPFQRSSHESYRQYADEHTPAGTPPRNSPPASVVVPLGSQSWGLARARSGGVAGTSSDGPDSGGESSQAQSPQGVCVAGGLRPAVAAPSQGLEGSAAAPVTAAGTSGTSSRRWSGSSGGASENVSAVKGLESTSGDLDAKLQITSKWSGKGKPVLAAAGVAAPTHQAINELQSMDLQGAPTAALANAFSEQTSWPKMPKHMRTITEDSLEYRLDSLQGNNSRPGSRGGLMGSSTGHNRGSSGGASDPSTVSPLAPSKTPVSALSASLAAAGDSSSFTHRHSHSHSGASGTGVGTTGNTTGSTTMSPLSRASSAQQAVLGSIENSGQQQASAAAVQESVTLSTRGSVESLGPCSVCTRITHNTSSGRSTPDQGGSSSRGPSSRRSSPMPDSCSRASSPETANTAGSNFLSSSSAATRDLSFGGMADLQQQRAQQLDPGNIGPDATDISLEQVHLSGLADVDSPAATVQGTQARAHHGYQTSVDFGAQHLQDLSRPDAPFNPEGGFNSPQPLQSRAARNREDSASGRCSPFANSGQLASSIAAGGVGNVDNFWSVGVERVPGVQSHPCQPAGTVGSNHLAAGQQQNSNKQRFRRPGPGWQPPSAGGAPQQSSTGNNGQQLQQQLGEQNGTAASAGAQGKSAAALQAGSEQHGNSTQNDTWPDVAEGCSRMASVASSAATTIRVNTASGLQGLHARAQRQRVMPRNISTGHGGPSGINSSEPSPGQAAAGWPGTSWQQQGSKGSNSAATSNSGHSRMMSPFTSSFVTPRDSQAVAGAATGAGQEMVAPTPAALLLSPGAAVKTLADVVDDLQVIASNTSDDDEGHHMRWDKSDFVVHPWWKDLNPAALDHFYEDGRPVLEQCFERERAVASQDEDDWPGNRTILAKPSVRYRKTINCWSEEEQRVTGVMAQHYAVLVTDVEQWPYPEMQLAYEATRQSSFPERAWQWVADTMSSLPQRMLWGLTRQRHWLHSVESLQLQEQQHLLMQQHQEGNGMSDKHLLDMADPGAAAGMLDAAAVAGGTSGGASVVVSRSSRGYGRGQLSSCATSSEGFGGCAGAGAANSLARASLASHATQLSYLPADAAHVECLMAQAEHDLAVKKQEALQSLENPKTKPQAAHALAKVDKMQADLTRMTHKLEQQQQALSREQSAYHLNIPSRSASYMRLGPLAASGVYGQAGAVPGGWAKQTVSRASSFRSVQQARADHAVAGAAVATPDASYRPPPHSNLPTRSQTPASLITSTDAGGAVGVAGIGAGPLTSDRLDSALAMMHVHREQQLRRRHGALQHQGSFSESPQLRGSSMLISGSKGDLATFASAVATRGMAATVGRSNNQLEQVLSEPVTVGASATIHTLQQQLSHPTPGAVPGVIPQTDPEAAGDASAGGHPLLVGDLSLEQPLPSLGDADTQWSGSAAISAAADTQGIPADSAVVQPMVHHHRRYVHRPASPPGFGPEGLAGRAELVGSPPPSAGSQVDAGRGRSWSSWPTSPEPGNGTGTSAGPPQKLSTSAAAVTGDSRPQSRSVGGALAGVAGMSDSYESNASSYAARRPVVSFKPYPPDSPKLREQQQGGFGSIVLVDGPTNRPQSLRTSVASRSAGRLAGSGGSCSFASGPLPLQAAGRSQSARLSCNLPDGSLYSSSSYYHPDHLSLLIPPAQQMPISRAGTPCGSGGGFAGSGGGLGGSGGGTAHVHLPPAPWGLPPDAALLTSSVSMLGGGVGSPVNGVLHGGSTRHRVSPAPQHTTRWSVTGVPAERSAGNWSVSHPTPSPLGPDQAGGGLIPAVGGTGGKDPAGFSRAVSAEAAMTVPVWDYDDDAKAAAAGQPEDDSSPIKRKKGWALVREAFNEKNEKNEKCRPLSRDRRPRGCRLTNLLQSDSYSVVTATFKRLFPEDFDKAIPVINHRQVDMLLMQWEAAVAELERAEAAQRRTGVPPTRFKGRLGEVLGCCATVGCGFKQWTDRRQLLPSCCEGHAVEIIPEIMERMHSLELQIEQARRKAFSSSFTPSWFVLFKSQRAASIAASTRIYAEDNTRFQVHPAPGPEEVNWQHLWMDYKERNCRTAVTWPLMLLLVLFPITLVTSAASRLEYVFCPDVAPGDPTPAFVWEWYCTGKEQGSAVPTFIRALFTGWLPSLLLNLWLVMVLPRLVYLIVQSEGSCFSLSALERRIGAVFYLWDVFNVFLQGTVGSTFFQQVRRIIQTPDQLPNILGAALPDSSNFFMQFIAMRALFLVWLRLCMPHGGVWQNWCHFCFCPASCCSTCNTDRDRSLTYGPRTPRYGFEMGHILLMYLIGLAFAIVSPLLLPFSVVWFMFAWVAWRHNLNYVYQRKYESGGLMWIFLFSRIVICMVIGQMFTFCVLVVKGAYWQAFLTIAFLPAITARFYRYCQARFARGIEYGVPLDLADRADKISVPPTTYIPPPLQDRSWGWYPEWNKIWDGWGMPAYAAV